MQYAIEMYYDDLTEKAIYDLAIQIADRGISSKFLEWKTRPHITLACFNDVDEDKCEKLLKDFAVNILKSRHILVPLGCSTIQERYFFRP